MINSKKSNLINSSNLTNLTNQNSSFKAKLAVLLAASICITACKPEKPDRSTIVGEAQYQASMIRSDIHAEYVDCYKLEPSARCECSDRLNEKYTKNKFREYQKYTKAFQMESEMLGFTTILIDNDLPCDGGVRLLSSFDKHKRGYEVRCSADQTYLIAFNYQTNSWGVK